MGPVRLFTPYKRKRRKENEDGSIRKVKRDPGLCEGVNGDESCDSNGRLFTIIEFLLVSYKVVFIVEMIFVGMDSSQDIATTNTPSTVTVVTTSSNGTSHQQITEETTVSFPGSMPAILARLDKVTLAIEYP